MPRSLNGPQRAAVESMLDKVRAGLDGVVATRESLAPVLADLQQLAQQDRLWSLEDFPCLDMETRQTRYLLHEDAGQTLALYLIVWLPGKSIAPHNHTTWACIAPVAGQERNTLYRRADAGVGPGDARIAQCGIKTVSRESGGLILMPDDIHAVDIVGDAPTVNLHLYGRALETLDQRLSFDTVNNRAAVRGVGAPSVRLEGSTRA